MTELLDIVQYLADAAAVGAFVFAWRTNARLLRLETLLSERDVGVLPTITVLKKSGHHVTAELAEHGARLDQHDRELDRLDRAVARDSARRGPPTTH